MQKIIFLIGKSNFEKTNQIKDEFQKENFNKPIEDKMPQNEMQEMRKETIVVNPRVTYIIRDEDGNIKNESSIGRFYDEYISYIEFDKNNLDSIYDIKVNDYNYRGITYKIETANGETEYIQLLINVDAEAGIIDNYFRILSVRNSCYSYIIINCKLSIIKKNFKTNFGFLEKADRVCSKCIT